NPRPTPAPRNRRLRDLLKMGELFPRVYLPNFPRIDRHIGDGPSRLDRGRDDVGQIDLSLIVVGLQLAERREEECGLDTVEADVHLAYRAHVGTSVALFDDGGDVAVAAHDPAPAEWIAERRSGQRDGGVLGSMNVDHP